SDAIGKYLFDANFALKKIEEKRSRSDNILNEFQKLTARYGYFEAQNALHSEVYKRCYDICEHTAKFIEHNDQADEVASRAFKMMALFSPDPLTENVADTAIAICNNIDNFCKKAKVTSKTPIHDTLMHDLPEYHPSTPEFNFPGWKSQLGNLGMDLVRNFSDVPKIERIIKADAVLTTNYPDGFPRDKNSFGYLLSKAKYDRYEENPEFGKIFKSYNAPEEMFNRALDLMRDGALKVDASRKGLLPKDQDSIPDIALKVAGKDDLYLVKLPSHDPRALILGQITGCCQSVSGHSEECVIDGVNLPNNGFYVFVDGKKGFDPEKIDWENLERKAKIVGQSYVWRGKDGALTLDSLEVLGSFRDKINVKDTMEALGKELSQKHQEIPRITLGMGGGTGGVLGAQINKDHGLRQTPSPESMMEGRMYGDSKRQYEVYVSESTKAARVSFSEKVQDIDNNIITSQAQSDFLIAFSQNHPDMNLNDIPNSLLKDHFVRNEGYDTEKVQQIYSDILSIPSEKRDICAKGCAKGWWKISDLKVLPEDKFRQVTSDGAIEGYKAGFWDKEYIQNLPEDRFEKITSDGAIEGYKAGFWDKEYITGLTSEQSERVTSNQAMNLYEEGFFDKEYVKDLTPEQFNRVISRVSTEGYRNGWWDKDYITGLTSEQYKRVTSYKLIEGYRNGWWDKNYVAGLTQEQFDRITFAKARDGYVNGLWDKNYATRLAQEHEIVTSGLTPEQFDRVISRVATEGYVKGWWDKDYLTGLTPERFDRVTSYKVINGYRNKWWTISDIKALTSEQLERVTSDKALDGYAKKWWTISDIKALTPERFDRVTSDKALDGYAKKWWTISDIKALTSEQLERVTSDKALDGYRNKWWTISDIKALTPEQFGRVTSLGAIHGYKEKFWNKDYIAALTPEQFGRVTSIKARLGYAAKIWTVKELDDLTPEQFKQVISPETIARLKSGMSFQDYLREISPPAAEAAVARPASPRSFAERVQNGRANGQLGRV
ncbi:MAG: hypothetical protein RLZZ59_326, partial [Pseudomonadota bacterium]